MTPPPPSTPPKRRLPILQGVLPLDTAKIPIDMIAGVTLAALAVAGTTQYVALAGLLALMTGVFLVVARLVRLGFLADFLSRTVLIGFLTGVGIATA